MATTNLETQCTALFEGRITFTAFAAETRDEFERMARDLMRRWTPPAWFGLEELVQELYLGAWRALFGTNPFDPTRGVEIARFVVYQANSDAKRALHKARGAKMSGAGSPDGFTSPDRRPSRFERPFSSFDRADGTADTSIVDRLYEEPVAERFMIMAESRAESVERAMRACTCSRERVAILALEQGGDIRGAAKVLHDDFDTRIALRLGSERNACRYVRRAVRAVVNRLVSAP